MREKLENLRITGIWLLLTYAINFYLMRVFYCRVTFIHESSVISAETYILFYEYSTR